MTEAPPHQLETGQPAVHAAGSVVRRSTRNFGDPTYRFLLTAVALVLPFLLLAIGAQLLVGGWPALSRFGIKFVTSTTWDPVAEVYGAAPMIFGTIVSSLLALLIAVPLALGTAIFLTEFAPKWLRQPIGFLVELLAAVPSVVYGLWGIFVLIPMLRGLAVPPLRAALGWTPFFKGVFYGPSMLAGGVILAIMIVPYIAAVSREVLLAVPATQREAALGLGATRWEAVWTAVLPYGRAGIIGAIMLGFGRALGETMAVTMVIGNRHDLGASLLAPAYTMAAAIANEFSEATTPMYLSALFAVGLVLFVVTITVNAFARLLVWRVAKGAAVGSKAL
jgi:phosphate transport system permease protein